MVPFSDNLARYRACLPNTDVGLFFVTARGNRMGPSGWNVENVPLSQGMTAADGSLTATVQIPDDLGGWHMVKLAARDRVLMDIPYYLEQSLMVVTPKRVKVGKSFPLYRSKGSAGPIWTTRSP